MVIGNNITSENLIIVEEFINDWQIASISKKKKKNLFEKYGSTFILSSSFKQIENYTKINF